MVEEIVQEKEKVMDTPASESVSNAMPQASNEAVETQSDEKTDILAEARKVRDENKKLLEKLSEERKKIERATAEIMMTGRSHAIPVKQETEDEKWEREAKIRYAGTGLDPTPTRK